MLWSRGDVYIAGFTTSRSTTDVVCRSLVGAVLAFFTMQANANSRIDRYCIDDLMQGRLDGRYLRRQHYSIAIQVQSSLANNAILSPR